MSLFGDVFLVLLLLSGYELSLGFEDIPHHMAHKAHTHKYSRRHRATNDGVLRFEPEPYSKKMELNSSGKIHCKVAGGVAPTVQWFLNDKDPLPAGLTSANGTLLVAEAARAHAGLYTCVASDGDNNITAQIHLDVIVSPRILEPSPGEEVHVSLGQTVVLNCVASGDPPPTIHWDKNLTVMLPQNDNPDVTDNSTRVSVLKNGTLVIRAVTSPDAGPYGCTAGSAAGLARSDLLLVVHPEGVPASSWPGKAVLVSALVAAGYMLLVATLMLYCRWRRLQHRQRGEKLELEMAEGREKLVEEGEEEKKANGAPAQNGRLLPHERDSGADNSEVSRASKKSGQYDHLNVPRSVLSEEVTIGRGEFGDVLVAKMDASQVKRFRSTTELTEENKLKPVLVKVLATKEENQLSEFRRQLDLFSIVKHDRVVRLWALCGVRDHSMVLEHTDWGDLKTFLISTRTAEENASYLTRCGRAHPALPPALPPAPRAPPPLCARAGAGLAAQLAAAGEAVAACRLVHRDIAARNCVITSQLQLKLSMVALTKGPDSFQYCKLHDQVIPLRWLPAEAVLESDYSTKSDVYSFAATVWEIFTKAELPFAKLNDNSVIERLKNGSLEWSAPESMPEKLVTLLKRCWSKSPTERPLFSEVCAEMAAILKDMPDDVQEENLETQA